MKLTKRKGFNFFRSYYDVYNELSDKDKVQFMDALLDRQFLGEKPTDLKGMAKFAYISQTNSIDSQVKGYEDKTGTKLGEENSPSAPPTDGGSSPPTEQVEGKEEEQVEGKEVDSTGSSDEQPVPIKFSFRKSLSELGVEKDVIDDWLKVRKTKKATNSKIALNAIIREIEKSGKEANEIIKICVINSWSGFKNEWFKNTINNGKKPKSTSESRMDAIKNF